MKPGDLEDRLIYLAVRAVNDVDEMIPGVPASDTGNSAPNSYFTNQQSSIINQLPNRERTSR